MDTIRSITTVSAAKYRGPDLSNSARFVRISAVPIIDVLERSYFKKDEDGESVQVKESVDKNQLKVLLHNSQERTKKGEYGPVFIGHTTDSGKEIDQPLIVGWLANYQMGDHNGNPTILADIYIDKEECDPSRTLRQFPRRSAEVIALDKSDGYIDSIALLKRTPERDLGLLTSHYSKQNLNLLTSRYSKRDNTTKFECPNGVCEMPTSSRSSKASRFRHRDPSSSSSSSEPSSSSSSEPSVERYSKKAYDGDEDVSALSDPSRMDPSDEPRAKKGHNLEKDYEKENKASLSKFESSSSSSEPSEVEEGDDEGFDEEVEDHESSSSEPSKMCRMEEKDSKKSKLAAKGTGGKAIRGEEPYQYKEPKSPPQDDYKPGPFVRDNSAGPPGWMTPIKGVNPKSSKMAADGGAGFPGAYDSAPPDINKKRIKSAKPTIKSSKDSSKMSRHNGEERRMARDSENIKVSRLQKTLDSLIQQNQELVARFSQADTEKRQAKIERQIAQLEYEGYELDRADEVTRFMKLPEDQIQPEIDRIKRRYSKSPVNQALIPSLSGDFGGSSLPKPERYVDPRLPLEEEYQQPAMPIIGSHIYRFYKENRQELAPPPPENPMAPRVRGDMTHATKVVSRFISSRDKSNV